MLREVESHTYNHRPGLVSLTTVESSLGVRRFRIIVPERRKKFDTFGVRELG